MIGLAAPLLAALALLLLAGWRRQGWLVALALPAAAMIGRLALGAPPRLPPLDRMDWMFWLALAAPALTWVRSEGARRAASGAMIGLSVGLLVEGPLAARAPGAEGLGLAALSAALVGGVSLARLEGDASPRARWGSAAALAGALALTLGLTGSLRLAGLALALCGATAPMALRSGLDHAAQDAANTSFCLIFLGLCVSGPLLSATPPSAVIALALALAAGAWRSGVALCVGLGLCGLGLALRHAGDLSLFGP